MTTSSKRPLAARPLRIGLVVPHIFMHRNILPEVIFSPAPLALDLAEGVTRLGQQVTLFSPGPVDTLVPNITADLSLFEAELAGRGYGYIELLKKHPLTFVSLARQVQAELIAQAFAMANQGQLDIVHIYTNEEDVALPFIQFCQKPVVLTHHDPFNLLIKYKNTFPKYRHLNWLSMSLAQRRDMPPDTNWVDNIYHGLDAQRLTPPLNRRRSNYVAYFGRIIEPKGAHLAIAAVQAYNKTAVQPLQLRIAGKHYAGSKDVYWQERIRPRIDDHTIEYVGFINSDAAKQDFLGQARAVLMPSTYNEPFGMVAIEALACGTPVIGLDCGALPEIIADGQTGFIVAKQASEQDTAQQMAHALANIANIKRPACRQNFEARFTTEAMCRKHAALYQRLAHAERSSQDN